MKRGYEKLLWNLLILCLVTGLAGCHPDVEVHHRVETSSSVGNGLSLLEELVQPEEESLDTYIYPETEILEVFYPNHDLLNPWSTEKIWETATILGAYPTPNIRKMGEDHYYACYMTETGTNMYLFFEAAEGTVYGCPVVMVKKLSHADFTRVAVGTPLSVVEEIDPATAYYSKNFRKLLTGQDPAELNAWAEESYRADADYRFVSVHLLTDGFLELFYKYGEDGTLEVSRVHFSPDFRGIHHLVDSVEHDKQLLPLYRNMSYSFEILEKDYVKSRPVTVHLKRETERIPVSEIDWSLPVIREGEEITLHLYRALKMHQNKIRTRRFVENDQEKGKEVFLAGGVALEVLLREMEITDYDGVEVQLADGSCHRLEVSVTDFPHTYLVWVEDTFYALQNNKTHLAIAVEDGEAESYLNEVVRLTVIG